MQCADNQRIMTAERKHRYCRVKAMLLDCGLVVCCFLNTDYWIDTDDLFGGLFFLNTNGSNLPNKQDLSGRQYRAKRE